MMAAIDHGLAAMVGQRKHLEQRGAADHVKFAIAITEPAAQFRHRAAAAYRGHVVAHRAAGAVEERPQAFFRFFNFAEVLEPAAELLELGGRHARQRIAGYRRRLGGNAQRCGGEQRGRRAEQRSCPHFTTSVARIAVCPAPHGREHSITNRPAVAATYFTTVSPRRRLGISALTSVPTIRNP